MHGTPNPSDRFVLTLHHPASLDNPQLLPVRVPQQLRLLEHLFLFQVPDADGLFPTINVGAADDGMSAGTGRDAHLDLGVLGREFGEDELEESAAWRGDEVSIWRNLRDEVMVE